MTQTVKPMATGLAEECAGSSAATVSSQLARLVFVGGSPRSGTTLVQRILDCHPDIYGGPEFDFVPSIAELFREMRGAVDSGRIDAILREQDLVHSFRTLLTTLLTPKRVAEGVAYLSEKTPSNILAFGWLDRYVPESRKIFVLRDPRDVVSSMVEVGRRQQKRVGKASGFTRDTMAAVNYMNRCLAAGISVAEKSTNCLVVYYEDAISDPLEVANAMFRFIGVPSLKQLDLESEQFEAARNRESWLDWASPGVMSGGVETDRVGIAAQRLSRSDLDYICATTLRHALLTRRYGLQSTQRTFAARCCVARCASARACQRLLQLWSIVRHGLIG